MTTLGGIIKCSPAIIVVTLSALLTSCENAGTGSYSECSTMVGKWRNGAKVLEIAKTGKTYVFSLDRGDGTNNLYPLYCEFGLLHSGNQVVSDIGINEKGDIVRVYNEVKPKEHTQEVLQEIQ